MLTELALAELLKLKAKAPKFPTLVQREGKKEERENRVNGMQSVIKWEREGVGEHASLSVPSITGCVPQGCGV